MKKFALSLCVIGALITSCSSDDDNSGGADNTVIAPATYQFERNGMTSVSYSGQTTRILMAEELIDALKDTSFNEAQLDAMFNHQEGDMDFTDASLNASDKSIRSKTAASFDFFNSNTTDANAIKSDFESWIAEQVADVYPNWANTATPGNSGQLTENGGSVRYVNAKGLELNQAVNKGLIGALMGDQLMNNYISKDLLAQFEAANDSETLVTDKNYTDMEHDWDEAFGYLYGTDDALAPQLNQDSFLNKYLQRVEDDPDFTGIAQDIYNAFKLGRAAIVAKNYDVRNEQAEIIREKVSEVIAIRAVYYLQSGKLTLGTDNASAFHDLSEGFGFIYSLQFTRKPNTDEPYFTKAEVDAFITQLMAGNGFWDSTSTMLDDMSDDIAGRFNFTVEEAAPSN